jgi:hypothetical protein
MYAWPGGSFPSVTTTTVYSDRVAENVEHSRENSFADRRLERTACILHRHAASETLRRREGDPAHVMRVTLRQDFDDDFLFRARAQDRVNRRQFLIEAHIYDAAAHRDNYASIRWGRLDVHGCADVSHFQFLISGRS